MDKKWRIAHENPPHNWKDIWSERKKISRFDTEEGANKYIKSVNEKSLKIDIHPKDGYVVYKI